MKLNQKQSVLPRLLALVFALALLLTLAITPVAAAKGDFTEWAYDPAARTLTATFPNGKTETYLRVEDHIHLRYDPAYDYEYRNTAVIDGYAYDVYAAEERGDVLAAVNAAGEWVFFATEKEMKKVAKTGAVGIKIDFVPPCDSKWGLRRGSRNTRYRAFA